MIDVQNLQVIIEIVISIGICGIIGLFTYLKSKKKTVKIIRTIKSAINDNHELAILSLYFIQKSLKDLDLDSKKLAVYENLSERVNKLGLKLTDEEIKQLINEALDELGDEFKKQWVGI